MLSVRSAFFFAKVDYPTGGQGRERVHGDGHVALRVAQVHGNQGAHRGQVPLGRQVLQLCLPRGVHYSSVFSLLVWLFEGFCCLACLLECMLDCRRFFLFFSLWRCFASSISPPPLSICPSSARPLDPTLSQPNLNQPNPTQPIVTEPNRT